jgi:hypothetical protein
MTEKQYEKALARIVNYLEGRGYTVKLNSNTFGYYEEDQLITAPTGAQGTIGLIIGLLHEAGHSEQSDSSFLNMRKSIKRDKAIVTEQEYTAWFHGWTIAEELKITTKELYTEYRKSWLLYWTQYIERLYKDNDRNLLEEIIDAYKPL